MPRIADHVNLLTTCKEEFLFFLRERFKLFHLSNVFFRDIHYGVMAFLGERKLTLRYLEAEELTRKLIGTFEEDGVLKKLDERTWLLVYPAFKAVSKKSLQEAKPAAKTSAQVAPATSSSIVAA